MRSFAFFVAAIGEKITASLAVGSFVSSLNLSVKSL